MSKKQDPAPSGKLTLVNYFEESSSGHVDTSRDVELAPHGKTSVLLKVQFEHNNVYRPTGPVSAENWTIDREELIALIKQHGQRV